MEDYLILDGNERYLLQMTNYCLSPSYIEKAHSHHYLEISFIKDGSGKYYIDDKVYDVKKGDIFIFNNIEKHLITVDSPRNLVNLVIHFEPRFIWSQTDISFDSKYLHIFYNRSRNFSNRLPREHVATEKIAKLFLEIQEEFKNSLQGFELMVKVKLLNIFVLISRYYDFTQAAESLHQNINMSFDTINKVLDFIDSNFEQEISLQTLAKIAHMNPSYFSTFFKKYNGISPSKYIRSKRIERALYYLKFTQKSITEISSLCGFNNMTSFYSSFKQVTSTSPLDYRRE